MVYMNTTREITMPITAEFRAHTSPQQVSCQVCHTGSGPRISMAGTFPGGLPMPTIFMCDDCYAEILAEVTA